MNKNHLCFVCIAFCLLTSLGKLKADELTVNNGTARNAYIPIYGYFTDLFTKSQFIIPEADLADLLYGTITAMTFYSQEANISWGNAKFEVYMTSVDYTTFSSPTLVDWTSMDKVMNAASLSIVNNQMVVTLDTPYQYIGGNLLVGVRQTQLGSFYNCKWYGVTASSAAIGGYESSRGVAVRNFLPKTTFHYTQGEPPSCPKPTSLSTTEVGPHYAILNWASDAEAWQLCLNDDVQSLIDVTGKPYTLAGLQPETTYSVKVRAICGNNNYSDWTTPVTFTTDIACHAPTNLCASLSNDDSTIATLSWTENGDASIWQICLNGDEQNLIEVTENPYTLTGLIPETVYTAKLRANCGDEDGTSLWSNTITFEPTEKTVIGSGTATNGNLPTNSYYNFSVSQQIYTVDELGSACLIESIDFYCTNVERTRNLDLYIVSTDKTGFDTTDDWVTVNNADLVFSGSVHFTPGTWTTIPLTNRYQYDGLHNLVIVVDDNTGSYQATAISFLTFEASTNQALFIKYDYTNYDPKPNEPGTLTTAKNQIRLGTSELDCVNPFHLTAHPVSLNSATLNWESDAETWQVCLAGDEENPVTTTVKPYTMEGLSPDTEYTAKVRTVCDDDVYSGWATCIFTTPSLCDVPSLTDSTEIMETQATLSWEGVQDSYNLRYSVDEPIVTTNDFEDGLIPATWNNDPTYPWTMVYDSLRDTHYIMSSNQGIASSTSVISLTATYPEGGTIEFDGDCWGEGLVCWDHCDFYIDDTLLLHEGINITPWRHYIYDVAAGEHTFTWSYTKDEMVDPTGDYFAIDNIVMRQTNHIWAPTIEGITETTYTLTGLTPNTTYYAQVQGNQAVCGDGVTGWSEMKSFTTLPYTQTIELLQGWNWVSTYINIVDPVAMLDMLKESLGENGLSIESAYYTTEFEGEEWFGELDDEGINNVEMYLIEVSTNCAIELQGIPANPANHSITIEPGYNWIGFPCAEEVGIAVALAGFAAEEGDQIESTEGMIVFDGEEWFGDIETFVPGHGYIYYSASTETKTLVFLTVNRSGNSYLSGLFNN